MTDQPAELNRTVQRNAPWRPEVPFWLADQATGAPPFDLTGATIVVAVRLYDDTAGDPLLLASTAGAAPDSHVEITDGPSCAFRPFFSEVDINALPAGALDSRTLGTTLRLRWDCRITLADGRRFFVWQGVLTVEGSVVQ